MKFVCNMIYGILSSKSCLLSEIGGNLNEKIPLRKTVTRLSRNLSDFNDGETLFEEYLKSIKNRYNDKSVLIIDGSDITKPAITKLEDLCEVRDGSTGEIGIGYHTLGAAVLSDRKLPYRVYSRIYSSREKDYVIEDDENLKSLKSIRNIDLMFTVAIGYAAELSGKSYDTKLRTEIIEKSKRLFGISDFIYYAVSDGIFEILKTVKSGIDSFFALPQRGGSCFCFLFRRCQD